MDFLLNIQKPELVTELHNEYIKAGADIITSNTFRTSPAALKEAYSGLNSENLVKAAIDAIKRADLYSDDIFIAGSNSPAEDCYKKSRDLSKSDLEYNHRKHIEILRDTGADIIWNETLGHMDEIEIITEFCHDNKIPFVINLIFDENLRLLDGSELLKVINDLRQYSTEAIGFNCIFPPVMRGLVKMTGIDYNWGFYLNCGSGNYSDVEIREGISPEKYSDLVNEFYNDNLLYVGSCCGSSPKHTAKIRELLNDKVY